MKSVLSDRAVAKSPEAFGKERTRRLSPSQLNHLRLLVGWVACEIGQSPEEMKQTLREIAPVFRNQIGDEVKARFVLAHEKASDVPKYVRAAVKALRKIDYGSRLASVERVPPETQRSSHANESDETKKGSAQ